MSVRTHLRPQGRTLGGQVLQPLPEGDAHGVVRAPGEAPCACDGPSICLIGSHPTAGLQDLVDCYNEEIDRRTPGGMHGFEPYPGPRLSERALAAARGEDMPEVKGVQHARSEAFEART